MVLQNLCASSPAHFDGMSQPPADITGMLHELRNRLMPMRLRIDAAQHLARGTSLELLMSDLHRSMQGLTALIDAIDTTGGSDLASTTLGDRSNDGPQADRVATGTRSAPLVTLLVDDNDVLAAALADFAAIDQRFAPMRHARRAADARQELAAASPQVVVLDVHLPDGDGIALCAELRQRHPDVAVAVLSGRVDDQLIAEAQAAGASAFIAKGCDPRATLDAVWHAATGGWTTLLP